MLFRSAARYDVERRRAEGRGLGHVGDDALVGPRRRPRLDAGDDDLPLDCAEARAGDRHAAAAGEVGAVETVDDGLRVADRDREHEGGRGRTRRVDVGQRPRHADDRAGEDAFSVGYSYDFGQVGAGKLSLFTNVVWGDTPDTGPIASPDASELDLTVDWRLNRGWSEKVWVRLRAAWVNQDDDFPGSDDLFDFRIIVNYDFDLL